MAQALSMQWCLPLQPQTPGNDIDILWETHWPEHLRSEHATISHLHPKCRPACHSMMRFSGIHARQALVGRFKKMGNQREGQNDCEVLAAALTSIHLCSCSL